LAALFDFTTFFTMAILNRDTSFLQLVCLLADNTSFCNLTWIFADKLSLHGDFNVAELSTL